jgi:SAM-dependent methyltransferase
MTVPSAARSPYQGVTQILRFNWRFYAGTSAGLAILGIVLPALPLGARAVALAASLPALFWLCASLLVSHHLYDRFPLYDFHWIARNLSGTPQHWVNIHAGLDETSHLLADLFPDTRRLALDIYDPREMTESSIAQARTTQPTATTRADWRSLPLSSGTVDAVFLIFAAHELRHEAARLRFFRELARVLRSNGEIVLMEHSRDWANFLAFGPGFLHFFSKTAWRRAAAAAGLQVRKELSMTPFVQVFILRRIA